MGSQWMRPPSLSSVICGFVALGAVFMALGGWLIVNQRLAEFQQAALAEAVSTRARGLQLDFARTLHQEWRAARIIAQDISRRDPASIRSSLDLLVGDNSRVSWAGIATLDGTITAASGGLLEGQNVSSTSWFRRGLLDDFAGDVRKAVRLASLLPSNGDERRRFVDLATPVRNAAGRVTGVLGLQIDFEWARRFLTETAHALEIDAFLVDRDGTVVMATNEALPVPVDLASMRAAAVGASTATVERWSDRRSYLTTVIPNVGYQDLPSFGWSLVARIDNEVVKETNRLISRTLLLSLAGFGLLLAAMTFLFIRIFAVPFRRLAEFADAIMARREVYPYESRRTSEAAVLSTALARYQTRVMNDRRKNRPGY